MSPREGCTVYADWVPVGADRGIKYTINGLAIRVTATFEFQAGIPNGSFWVEVSVANVCSAVTDTVLRCSIPPKSKMLGMQHLYVGMEVGQMVTFGASVDNSGGKVGSIKVFVLPVLGSSVPLVEAKEIQ